MKFFKQTSRQWFTKLHPGWFGQPVLSAQDEARCLAEINESKEPASIPAMLHLLRSGTQSIGDTAADTIEQIVNAADSATIACIDQLMREVSLYRLPDITAFEVRKLSRGLTGPLGIMSCHPSGFTREAAVIELAKGTDGRELPFLLIRLNDWVLPVREAARKAVQERIIDDYAEHFIRCLPLVQGLLTKGRVDHSATFNTIIGLLGRDRARPPLRRALLGSNREVGRLAFRLLLQWSREDVAELLTDAMDSQDAALRLLAAREVRTRMDGEPLRQMLARLLTDRFAPIRCEALYAYAEKLPDLAAVVFQSALVDPYSSVRQVARFFLRRAGRSDFANFYASLLNDADENRVATAVAGLGEVGKASDAILIARFFGHQNRIVRRAAVRAVGHLNAEKFTVELLMSLEDEHAAVAKAARDVLLAHLYLIKPTDLTAVLEKAVFTHTRTLVLSLIAHLQWWDSAALLVAAASCDDETPREMAIEYLRRSRHNCGRLTVRPSEEQLRALSLALSANRTRLDPKTVDDLETHLRLGKLSWAQ